MPIIDDGFEHKEFDEMALKLGRNKRNSISLRSRTSENQLYCLICSNIKNELSGMLYSKLPKLFSPIIGQSGEELNLEIRHTISKHYEPYMLNDDINDQFNSVQNFNAVNQLILLSKFKHANLNTKEALALLTEIEEQINNEKEENFLLDGI